MFSSYSPTTDSCENIIFGDNSKGDVIGLGKVAITLKHSISDVLHLIRVVTICCQFHNFVRKTSIVSLRIRVWKSLVGRIPLLS
jgi:hypothetical protein